VEYLLGPTTTLILAALLLVLVGTLPALPPLARGTWSARVAVLVPILALGVGGVGVWRGFQHGKLLSAGFPASIVRYAAQDLNAATEPTVIVIEGGSYVLNGVDAELMMDEFHQLGSNVRVVRIAAGAANHFERYRMGENIVQRLVAKRPRQRWIYLSEVHLKYDSAPLAQFMENLDSARTYDYATLPNAWAAARALRSPGVQVPDGWQWKLFRHALINSFSAGASSRYVPDADVELGGGRANWHRKSRFRFRGMSRQIATLSEPVSGAMLPWLEQVREPRTRRLWRPYTSELVYFGLPAANVEQLSYVRGFCAATRVPCIAPADPELLSALDNASLWRDSGHLMKRGAEIYSRWLARQLVVQKVVKRKKAR
jgi:hypothetical protein